MSDQPSSSSGMAGGQRRRPSIVELFNPRSSTNASVSSSAPAAATAVPVPSHGRSISSAGLAGTSPVQSSPYTAFAKQRRASISTSSGSGSPEFRNTFSDEAAVIEEDDQTRGPSNAPPSPSFGRRLSFGAQALRDVKGGSMGGPGGGRRPSSSLPTLNENNENFRPIAEPSSRTATTGGDGFNWSEALLDRTKRSPSFSMPATTARPRASSTITAEPPKEMPKPIPTPTRMKKPDHLGERMLRGDFMMD